MPLSLSLSCRVQTVCEARDPFTCTMSAPVCNRLVALEHEGPFRNLGLVQGRGSHMLEVFAGAFQSELGFLALLRKTQPNIRHAGLTFLAPGPLGLLALGIRASDRIIAVLSCDFLMLEVFPKRCLVVGQLLPAVGPCSASSV